MQLPLYLERQVKPRRTAPTMPHASRWSASARLIDWRQLLVIVKPDTLICWHRKGVGLIWRWKSHVAGRPRIPANLRPLIAEMATANWTWGEERIAAEFLVKLGIDVSPQRCDGTCRRERRRVRRPGRTPGAPACGITRSACRRAISSSRPRTRFVSCICSWSGKSAPDVSSTGTRRSTDGGPPSSSA